MTDPVINPAFLKDGSGAISWTDQVHAKSEFSVPETVFRVLLQDFTEANPGKPWSATLKIEPRKETS